MRSKIYVLIALVISLVIFVNIISFGYYYDYKNKSANDLYIDRKEENESEKIVVIFNESLNENSESINNSNEKANTTPKTVNPTPKPIPTKSPTPIKTKPVTRAS